MQVLYRLDRQITRNPGNLPREGTQGVRRVVLRDLQYADDAVILARTRMVTMAVAAGAAALVTTAMAAAVHVAIKTPITVAATATATS